MAWKDKDIEIAFKKILEHIEAGNSLRSALMLDGTPASEKFYKLLREDSDKAKQYARATKLRADNMFEDLIELVERRDDCMYLDDNGNKRTDGASIQAKRLEVDAKKWALSKLHPKVYGDKIDVTTDGESIRELSMEERKKKIEELKNKLLE